MTLGALISLLVPNIPAEHEMPAASWQATSETGADAEPDAESEPEPTPA